MNSDIKIKKIKMIEKSIEEKKATIEEKKRELEDLKKQLKNLTIKCKKENQSELPILLFIIDETAPMPEKDNEHEFEYIYYCADIDKIVCKIERDDNTFLPHTIDLTRYFENLGMPKKFWPGKPKNYWKIVEKAVSHLDFEINFIYPIKDIKSWSELGEFIVKETDKTLVKRLIKRQQ